jgi:hypothetical protein
MPFIETSDLTSLFYKDWGTGKPVLFLHRWCLQRFAMTLTHANSGFMNAHTALQSRGLHR